MYKTTIRKSDRFLLHKQEIEINSNGRILTCSFDDIVLSTSYLVVDKYVVLGKINDRLKVNQYKLKGAVNYMLTSQILLNVSFEKNSPNEEESFDFFQSFRIADKNLRLKNVNSASFLMSAVNVRHIPQTYVNNVKILILKGKEVSIQNNPHFLIYYIMT